MFSYNPTPFSLAPAVWRPVQKDVMLHYVAVIPG